MLRDGKPVLVEALSTVTQEETAKAKASALRQAATESRPDEV